MKNQNLVRTIILAGSLWLQTGTLCFHSRGAAGDVDLSFDPGSGVNGTVNAIAVQPDGKVLIGGEFTTVNGLARFKVARLNPDGSGDSSFNPALSDYELSYPVFRALSVALQSDGKVLVGHNYGITRLNSNGSRDTNFVSSLGFYTDPDGYPYADVRTIAVQPDGKVLVGGAVSAANRTDVNFSFGVARLNSNGSLDYSFNPRGGANGGVYSLALQPDGKVLVGGGLLTDGTNYTYGLVRLNANGSLDGSFDPGQGGPGGFVSSVALQSDGKVLVGGNVPSGHGTSRAGAARLNPNGGLDTSFDPRLDLGGAVDSVAAQADGKVLVGGWFGPVNGTNQNGLARYNADGSLDISFSPNLGPFSEDVAILKTIVVQSNGTVLIGGHLSAVNGVSRDGIARLNVSGSLDGGFNPGKGVDNLVTSLLAQPDGKVLIGGDFTTVKNLTRSALARLNADGSGDSGFKAPFTVFDSSEVQMVLQPDGKVLVAKMLARLNTDGSRDTAFIPDLAAIYRNDCWPNYQCLHYPAASAIALQSDGKVLLGGYSIHSNCDNESCVDSYRHFIIRLNPNGTRDSGFEPAVGNQRYGSAEIIQALAVQPDGKIVVGGIFSSIKGTNRNAIARLNADGTLDNGFNPGTGANGGVASTVLQPDGKVLVSGYFSAFNGTNRNGIARLNANGSLDSTFAQGGGANGGVRSIALQPDGKVLMGGDFTTVNGTNRNHIARLNANGSLDLGFNPGTGADEVVRSIALQSDGNVLIGGDFTFVNGVVRPNVARLLGNSTSLTIARLNGAAIVAWPLGALNFQLQETTNLSWANAWAPVAHAAVTNGGQISVSIPAGTGAKFFRLKAQ